MCGKGAICALKYRNQPKEFQVKQCELFMQVSHKSKWISQVGIFQMKMIALLAEGKGVDEAISAALSEVDADLQSDSLPCDSSLKELIEIAKSSSCKTESNIRVQV